MDPATIQAAIFGIEEVVKIFPQIKADLVEIFTKKDATPEDFNNLRLKVASESYRNFVPGTALPPAQA